MKANGTSKPANGGSTDCRGVPVSYGHRGAIEGMEQAHECALSFRGDAIATIDQVLEEHPRFIMGHLFKAGWLTQAMETRVYDDMVAAVAAAEALSSGANDRERGHLAAMQSWLRGDFFGALQKWEEVLTHYPRDLLALQLAHLTDVLLGDVVGQRDVVARVFNLWDENVPGYEFVLGFYSFGLEENADYFKAEEMGRRSLALRPDNPYAVHAVGHVMEMNGRQSGGIRFMADYVDDWGTSHFANHLWWHTALYHYDNHLRSGGQAGDKYEELDASALLWRLRLLDVDTGDRWKQLADRWEPSAQDTLYAFNDVHAMMTFVSDDRIEAQEALLSANERYVRKRLGRQCRDEPRDRHSVLPGDAGFRQGALRRLCRPAAAGALHDPPAGGQFRPARRDRLDPAGSGASGAPVRPGAGAGQRTLRAETQQPAELAVCSAGLQGAGRPERRCPGLGARAVSAGGLKGIAATQLHLFLTINRV
jgi:hypothetical protein